MESASFDLSEASQRHWDVIIIGTGMAGSTIGLALAKAGKQVLFCERGKSLLHPKTGLRGNFAETFFEHPTTPNLQHREVLLQAGRYAEEIEDVSYTQSRQTIPFIGCGTGGSSALYGAAMERFFPADFAPRKNHPNAPESTLPDQWPVSYTDMQPYYERAEQLFRVRGSTDACHPDLQASHFLTPPPFGTTTQELNDLFTDNGLHPYRLPQACEFVPGCHGCQGFLCPNNCKNDSTRICLLPALEKYNACLLDECEVVKLESSQDSITGVICNQHDHEKIIRGSTVILAAGALETPRLLLNSNTKQWPDGLANDSGLVGRNLMRHYVDLYALLPRSRKDHPGNLKELAFNDFYQIDDHKFGTVQSFGALPPSAVIVDGMEKALHDEERSWLVPFLKIGKPLIRPTLEHMFSRRVLFASIMEDIPYLDNQVMLTNGTDATTHNRLSIRYNIRPHEQNRIQLFRNRLAEAFSPNRFMIIKQAENNERIAHACGTCRFGLDPKESVLDMNNRAHRLDNLYIVDSSFFPSSAGTNPSLTLAANALRVAEQIL